MEIEWTLVLYSLFMGFSIGPFALLALTDACGKRDSLCKWATLAGLASIVIAGLSAFMHLKQPLKAIYIFSNFRSPMTQETVLVLLTGVVAALLVGMFWFNWLPGPIRKTMAWAGLVLGVFSVFLIASIYLLPSRPAWNSLLLPFTLLFSSLTNGLLLAWALAAVVPLQKGEKDRRELAGALRSWALPALALYGLLAIVYFLTAGAAGRLLTGDLALAFWLGLVVLGLVAPAALLWLGKKEPGYNALLAFVLVAAGGLVVRALLFPIGTIVPIQSLW